MTQGDELHQLAHPLIQASCTISQSLHGERGKKTLPVERIARLATAAHRRLVTVYQLFIMNNMLRLTAFSNLDHKLQLKRLQIEQRRISTSLLQFFLQN